VEQVLTFALRQVGHGLGDGRVDRGQLLIDGSPRFVGEMNEKLPAVVRVGMVRELPPPEPDEAVGKSAPA
jgi:hypothetical protein